MRIFTIKTMIKKIIIGVSVGIFSLVVLGIGVFLISPPKNAQIASQTFKGVLTLPPSIPTQQGAFSQEGLASDIATAPLPSITPDTKKIIRNAFLSLVIDNMQKSTTKITALVEAQKGFVESLERREDESGVMHASFTLRVPVASFSDIIEKVKAQARLVEIEQITGQDVTQEYIDLEARLKNLKATEAQYLEILKKAYSIEDILKVTQRLSDVRAQIESLQGQLKYLANQTDLATIRVNLSQEPTITLSIKDFRPSSVVKAAVNALVQGLITLFNILIAFIIVWIPIMLISVLLIGLAIFLLWKIVKFIKQKFFK